MPVFCQLQLDRVPRINSKVSYRNVAAINLDALWKDLSNSILCENMESFDLNELVNCYNKTLNSILDQYAPLKTKTVTKRPIVPWFNEQVKAAKRQRRKAEKKWRRTNFLSRRLSASMLSLILLPLKQAIRLSQNYLNKIQA